MIHQLYSTRMSPAIGQDAGTGTSPPAMCSRPHRLRHQSTAVVNRTRAWIQATSPSSPTMTAM